MGVLFVYLNRGTRIVLPTAVLVQYSEGLDALDFVDETERVVAQFPREDVWLYAESDPSEEDEADADDR